MPMGYVGLLQKSPAAFESSAFGSNTTGSSNISASTTSVISVTKPGAIIAVLEGRHSNWVNTYNVKTITSNLGSTFTEIPGSDTVRGPSGQRTGHTILFICLNPAIGDHTLSGNIQASQSLTEIDVFGAFYSNIVGWQNLTTQSTTGNSAINLSITSAVGNIPFIGVNTNNAMAGANWTERATLASNNGKVGDKGLTATAGAVSFTTSSTGHTVAACGVDLIAA